MDGAVAYRFSWGKEIMLLLLLILFLLYWHLWYLGLQLARTTQIKIIFCFAISCSGLVCISIAIWLSVIYSLTTEMLCLAYANAVSSLYFHLRSKHARA